jgi:hypothetical protein
MKPEKLGLVGLSKNLTVCHSEKPQATRNLLFPAFSWNKF